jgi:hypothetical protein
MKPEEPTRSHHAGYKVVTIILLVSLAIGVTAYYRFVQSEKHLTSTLAHFLEIGPQKSALGCVEDVVEWSKNCSAMLSLCEDSVQRMMGACLQGRSREDECAAVESVRRKTSFGYDDCSARGLDRVRKRACADAYRAFDKYCEDRVGP